MQKKKKILLVEDSYLTVEFIADFLHENGYETKATSRGEEAVQKIKNGLPIDLILMDIGLEGEMDGIEAARRILEFRDVPVVFITANTSEEVIEKIKQVKAYGFVQKGIKKAAMLSTVEMALKLHEANALVRIKEAMLSAIMDATQNSIIMFDEQRNVMFCNLATERLFGYSRVEIMGKKLNQLVVSYEYIHDCHQGAFKHFQLTGESNIPEKPIELKVQCKDGREIDVEVSFSAFNLKGTWYGLVFVQDISIRKQEQEKLEKSRREYLELAENSPVGVLKCDIEGNITYVNKKALEILGSPSIEETKKINLFTFHLLVEHGLSKIVQECLQNNQSDTKELNYQTKWGKKVWLRAHIKLLAERDEVTGIQIIIDEITEEKRLEEKLHFLCVTDELTGAYNRRYIKEKLEEEIERGRRTGNTFSIIMFDIDNFKKANDCYGHNVGDLILETLTKEINNRIRKVDILARWGGEEFMILLIDTPVKNSTSLAEELRKQLSQMDVPGAGRVTASFGVAGYYPGDSIDTLVKRADNMMYKAKNDGRNCVRCADECR